MGLIMSWDILLVINTGVEDMTVWESNYTYNVSKMLYEAGLSVSELNNKDAIMAGTMIERTIKAMRSDPERFKKFNPKNGWGDYYGCVEWLKSIAEACMDHPRCIVKVM